jgi:osmoprotectant transport system permease protein
MTRFPPDWLARNRDLVLAQLREHLELTLLTVLIAIAVTIPLALWARRVPRLRTPLLALTGTLYTIPSLALFVLLVAVTGLTRTTALIGLVAYSLLILLRNILVALEGVPVEVRDAAVAMGHTPRQLLWRVEAPLALPVALAGVRLATVSTIGLVTITALIGYGGLGRLFLIGFQRRNGTALLTGFALSLLLAVAADLALARLERRLTPWADTASARARNTS